MSEKESLIKSPVSLGVEIKKTNDRKVLEFVPNTIKEGEAIIVRTKKWAGLSEACFVVCLNNGKISIVQLK